MRKSLFILLVLVHQSVVLLSQNNTKQKNNFKLEITVTDTKDGFILIRNLTKPLADTMKIVNGVAKFQGYTQETLPHIIADENNKYQLFFIGVNDDIKITLNKKDMIVTFLGGSASHEVFRELIVLQEPLQKIGMELQQAYEKPNAKKDTIDKKMELVNNKLRDNFFDFIKRHDTSLVTAFVIYSAVNNDRNIRTSFADSMFQFLKGKARVGFYGTELNKMMSKLKAIEVGYIAPDFTLKDSSGKKSYSLHGLRGKYVLVDFWASWCGPCKAEIPFLKKAYEKYHSKGFEIMSVSLDDKKDAWLNSLKQFQMPWIQVSDVKGFNSIVNDLYHVPAIPKTLLLDKNGTIISTDLRGDALENKLKELLGE